MTDGPQPGLPFGPGGPFQGPFDLHEVMRLLKSEGPLNFDVARQVATWVASQEPAPTGPDDGLLAELTRTAQIHVQEATGLGARLEPSPRTVDRERWAEETLEGLRPTLTTLAERLTASGEREVPDDLAPGETADLGALMTAMAPVLLGVQAGFMIGHLATRVLARYETPLPLAVPPSVCYVGPNLAAFEQAWQLPSRELRFYVALHEVIHAALRSVPWVQDRLVRLTAEYVAAFDVDPLRLEQQLDGLDLDPADPSSFERAFGNPVEFLATVRPPAQVEAQERLRAAVVLLEGYADHVLERVGRPLIPEFDRIREASHRHRVERGDAARFLEALLGYEVGRDDYERAGRFCQGVVERAGEDALGRLWESERMMPTPAELDAPGLWLERIALPD